MKRIPRVYAPALDSDTTFRLTNLRPLEIGRAWGPIPSAGTMRAPSILSRKIAMRWSDWILRQLSQSRQSARRTTRLAVCPLEDRTVPAATGVVPTDHPTDPAPTTAVVKEETPPAPTPDPVIHLTDPVVEPTTGSGEAKDGGVAPGSVTPEEKIPPDGTPTDPVTPKIDG